LIFFFKVLLSKFFTHSITSPHLSNPVSTNSVMARTANTTKKPTSSQIDNPLTHAVKEQHKKATTAAARSARASTRGNIENKTPVGRTIDRHTSSETESQTANDVAAPTKRGSASRNRKPIPDFMMATALTQHIIPAVEKQGQAHLAAKHNTAATSAKKGHLQRTYAMLGV
jgi:hypothetical protein